MINQCVFFDRMMTCDECDEFNLQGCGGVAVGWSIRLDAEDWVFESQPQQKLSR